MNSKEGLYRLVCVRARDSAKGKHLNDIFCEKVNPALNDLQDSLLRGFWRVDTASIGSTDNPCTRYIYENRDREHIYIYVYPPKSAAR